MGDAPGREPEAAGSAQEATPAGAIFAEVQQLGVVDSTNRALLDAAREGAAEGTVMAAEEQTAGRGRLGRRWLAPAGSALLASFLFRPELPLEDLHLLTTLVALAARDACRQVAGVEAGLKWPNDLEVGDRKLGGILAETVPGALAVVVGIGVNVSWPVDPAGPGAGDAEDGDRDGDGDGEMAEVAGAATSLHREGAADVDAGSLLERLVELVDARYAALRADGAAALVGEYRSACSTIGRHVRVELADGLFEGTAVDVNDGGRLLVEVGDGVRDVEAADVVHVRRD